MLHIAMRPKNWSAAKMYIRNKYDTKRQEQKKKQNVVGVSIHAKIKNIESNKNRLV